MKKKQLHLSRLPSIMLKLTLIPVCIAYLYILFYVYSSIKNGFVIMTDISEMIEYATMSLLISVAASLIFDIHIKKQD